MFWIQIKELMRLRWEDTAFTLVPKCVWTEGPNLGTTHKHIFKPTFRHFLIGLTTKMPNQRFQNVLEPGVPPPSWGPRAKNTTQKHIFKPTFGHFLIGLTTKMPNQRFQNVLEPGVLSKFTTKRPKKRFQNVKWTYLGNYVILSPFLDLTGTFLKEYESIYKIHIHKKMKAHYMSRGK